MWTDVRQRLRLAILQQGKGQRLGPFTHWDTHFFGPSVRKGARSEAGQIRLHTHTHTDSQTHTQAEKQYKSRQQMWPCSVCIRFRDLSLGLFHLINADYLQLPHTVIPSASCRETKRTLTNSCQASRDTNSLHIMSFQSIPFIPQSVFQHAHGMIAFLLPLLFFLFSLSVTFPHLIMLRLCLMPVLCLCVLNQAACL